MERRTLLGSFLALFGIGCATSVEQKTVAKAILLPPAKFKKLTRIRIWRLGSLEHKIYPTDAALQKKANILSQWDGKSDLDLVWGPDIECEEHLVCANDINLVMPASVKVVKSVDGKLHFSEDK